MSFLTLCQDLHTDIGLSGSALTTVVSQTGMNGHVVDWVAQADHYLQSLYHDWQFMLKSASRSVTTGNQDVVNATDFSMIDKTSMAITDGTTKTEVDLAPYRELRDELKLDVPTGRPDRLAIKPDKSIMLSTSPDQNYTLTFDYYQEPIKMTTNSDVSLIPSKYHRLIILQAKMYYVENQGADYRLPIIIEEYKALLERMASEYLPGHDYGFYGQNENLVVVPE